MSLPKKNWYSLLISDPENTDPLSEAYDYYIEQYDEGRREADLFMRNGKPIEAAKIAISSISAYRYDQLQGIEQLMEFLENREKRLKGVKRRLFREHYNRELNDSMVERYVESDADVLNLVEVRNWFALVRNKFLALTKQHEIIHYQLLSVGKLRAAGIVGSVF
jgi:hypothetical protein